MASISPATQTSAPSAQIEARIHAPAQRASVPGTHLLREDVFRHVLSRESHRAERFGEPFALVLVEADRAAVVGAAAVDVLAGQKAVVAGWVDADHVLGVIVPAGAPERAAAEVARQFAAGTSARCSVHAVQGPASLPTVTFAAGVGPARRTDASKRALDVVLSAALLLMLWPLLLLIAIAVKWLSPGPVVFRQERVGYMGRPFTILKFRTMRVDADPALHREFITHFIEAGSRQRSTRKPLLALADDPRVTRVGRFLRRTGLDELPQLWNVLRGDMSLVGPRPALGYEVAQYRPWHRRRLLEAKPGLTGLWQVVGRHRTTFDDMVRLDLRYAQARSVWTDVKILLATPGAVVAGRGLAGRRRRRLMQAARGRPSPSDRRSRCREWTIR